MYSIVKWINLTFHKMRLKTNFMPAILAYTEIYGEELSKMLAAWEFIIYVIFEGFHLSAACKQMGL